MDWDRFWNRHKRDFYNYAYRLLGNKQDAEDCVMLAVIRCVQKSALANTLKKYMINTIRNISFDMLRRGKPEISIDIDDVPMVAQDQFGLVDLLESLPPMEPKDRRIVELIWLEQLSAAECAKLFNTTEAAVKSRLYRLRVANNKWRRE